MCQECTTAPCTTAKDHKIQLAPSDSCAVPGIANGGNVIAASTFDGCINAYGPAACQAVYRGGGGTEFYRCTSVSKNSATNSGLVELVS